MSDLQVKSVATCKCGCGEVPAPGKEYVWGHKGGAKAEVVVNEKCHCGRAKGHTGRHIGSNPAKKVAAVKVTASAADGRVCFASILKHLEVEHDRIEAAIEAIRPLVTR
jgi:hypothetical protein